MLFLVLHDIFGEHWPLARQEDALPSVTLRARRRQVLLPVGVGGVLGWCNRFALPFLDRIDVALARADLLPEQCAQLHGAIRREVLEVRLGALHMAAVAVADDLAHGETANAVSRRLPTLHKA